MSVQVRFCFQMNSGEVRFCCQMSCKNSVCGASWILEMQVGASSFVVPVSMVGLPSHSHSHSSCSDLRRTKRERRACWEASWDTEVRLRGKLRVVLCNCLPHPLAQITESYMILENESEPNVPTTSPGLVSLHTVAHPWKLPLKHPNGGC